MIGSDEFHVRSSRPASAPIGDSSEVEYIEAFIAPYKKSLPNSGYLIDIVCPQPQSKRPHGTALSGKQDAMRAARTSDTNDWRK